MQTGKVLKNYIAKNGYAVVNLYDNGSVRQFYVHRLVAASFLGKAPSGKDQVAHYDGDRTNAAVGNLRWASQSENELDKRRHGTSKKFAHYKRKFTNEQVRKIRDMYGKFSNRYIARMFGTSHGNIKLIAEGRTYRDA